MRSFQQPVGRRDAGAGADTAARMLVGGWRARFDTARPGTGAEDGAEISMEILPSKTLQQLEKQIRQRPVGTAWQLSGEVVVSKDRNYLVLTRAVAHPADKFISP